MVKDLQATLKRNQTSHKNVSLFDQMKKDLDHARKLLRILPVWILSPDDVARLFPCADEIPPSLMGSRPTANGVAWR